jgi:hypothetical protein
MVMRAEFNSTILNQQSLGQSTVNQPARSYAHANSNQTVSRDEVKGDTIRVTINMIAKGVITDEEFKTQLGAERANYLAVLKRLH